MSSRRGVDERSGSRARPRRGWLAALRRRLLGIDIRANLDAIHIATSDAVVDLGEDIEQGLEIQLQTAATDIVKRTDLLVESLDRKIETLFARLSRRLEVLERSGRPFSDQAYMQFEEEARGSERDVADKLRRYVGLLKQGPVVDIGCGRGELLEAFMQVGVEAYGVDINRAMVHWARSKGLKVLHENLFDHLERLEDSSLGGVVATHVIEHLSPPAVRRLLIEAHRVLAPGGRIVLETPNPTSLWAFAQNWMKDPTHRWAVHPDTLSFMAARAGLQVVDVIFTSPVPEEVRLKADDPDADRLNEFLYGPQDFALVAKRPEAPIGENSETARAASGTGQPSRKAGTEDAGPIPPVGGDFGTSDTSAGAYPAPAGAESTNSPVPSAEELGKPEALPWEEPAHPDPKWPDFGSSGNPEPEGRLGGAPAASE